MTPNPYPTRVRYYDGQFLQAADLQTDQAYHRHMRWRHNLALHSWGVVAGLEVVPPEGATPDAILVSAGMALDGYGRELVLAQNTAGRRALVTDQSYDVWLVYAEGQQTARADRGGGCASAGEDDRYREQPRVRITPTAERQSPDVSRPDGVPVGDLGFGPDRPPPTDTRPWPVFLGRLEYREKDGQRKWVVDGSERRYSGLAAERIVAPLAPPGLGEQRRTVIFNGGGSQHPDQPEYRFAVAVAGPTDPVRPEETPILLAVRELPDPGGAAKKADADVKAAAKVPSKRHVIELQSERVTVAGDVILRDGAALEFRPNPVDAADAHAGRLTGTDHWRMYHHFESSLKSAAGAADPAGAGPSFSDELRITMPSTPAGGNRVAVGYFEDGGTFKPVLVVKDDRSVEVYGSLVVKGRFEGIQTNVPDGTAVGGGGGQLSGAQVRTLVGQHLRGTDPNRFANVLQPVLDVGIPEVIKFVTLPGNLGKSDVQRFTEAWWPDVPFARAIGEASAASREGTFTSFLNALDTVKRDSGAGDVLALQVILNWLFSRLPADAEPIKMCTLPASPTHTAAALAKPLRLQPAQLNALLDALIDDGATDQILSRLLAKGKEAETVAKLIDAKKDGLMIDKLIDAGKEAVMADKLIDANKVATLVGKLVSKDKDAEMINGLFIDGHRSKNFKQVGEKLKASATPQHAQKLLEGMGDQDTMALLAAELFDGKWAPPPPGVTGKRGVAIAFWGAPGDPNKLPDHPHEPALDPTNPDTFIPVENRLRVFFKHVKDSAGELDDVAKKYTQLKKSIQLLATTL